MIAGERVRAKRVALHLVCQPPCAYTPLVHPSIFATDASVLQTGVFGDSVGNGFEILAGQGAGGRLEVESGTEKGVRDARCISDLRGGLRDVGGRGMKRLKQGS